MSFRFSKKKKKDGKKMLFLMVLFRTLTAAPPIVVCQLREGYWFSIHFKVLKMQTSNTAQQENAFMTVISLQFCKKQKTSTIIISDKGMSLINSSVCYTHAKIILRIFIIFMWCTWGKFLTCKVWIVHVCMHAHTCRTLELWWPACI